MTETEHKRSRCHISYPWGKGDTAHSQKDSLGIKNEGVPSENRWCQGLPHRPLGWNPCNMHSEKSLKSGQVWKKKPENWPKIIKDLEELPSIYDATISLLYSSSLGRTVTCLLPRCAALYCIWHFSMCSCICCSVSLIINFASLLVFASLEMHFSADERAKGILLLASNPWWTSDYDCWFSYRLPRVNSWAGN